jgi:hypothetical protein
MKKLFGLFLLAVTLMTVNANTYTVIDGPFNWLAAKVDAESRGGHLATITSEAEWIEIQNQIGMPINDIISGVWLGGSDKRTETWEWITGETWGTYVNWAPDEPSGVGQYGPEHYLSMYGDTGLWNDGTGFFVQSAPIGYLLELGSGFNTVNYSVPETTNTLVMLIFGVGCILYFKPRFA